MYHFAPMKRFLSVMGMIIGAVLFIVLFSISPTVRLIFVIAFFILIIVKTVHNSLLFHRKFNRKGD